MAQGVQEPVHVWLVMMKAMRALTKYAAADIEETGIGLTDFGVLEVLLHKGPLPVTTIGPIVDLTPGSISIAVDRLFAKGLVSRVESPEDRRLRIVALTPRPILHYVMFVRRSARHSRRRGLIEEGHREVSEIEKPAFNPVSLMQLLKNPLRRLFGKPTLACAANDYGDGHIVLSPCLQSSSFFRPMKQTS